MKIYPTILQLIKRDKFRKASTLYVTMGISVLTGILISVINTRLLGKEQYGDFKFIINLFTFAATFFTLGAFYSGGRLLAKSNDQYEQRNIIGTVLLFATVASGILMVIFFVLSFFENSLFNKDVAFLIRLSTPFIFGFLFQLCFEQLLQGNNRIYALSWLRIGPKLVYLLLVGLVYFGLILDVKYALLCHLISLAIVIFSIVILLKPHFTSNRMYYHNLLEENKTWGFPAYLGSITGVASSYLAGITISIFIDNVNVGFYSLAITASMPLAMLPSALGTTFFKDFVTWQKIPIKVIIITLLIAGFMLMVFLFFIDDLVHFLYPAEFGPVIKLAYYTAIGSFFHGIGDFFNKFISAKGKGKLVMKSNFILGAFNVLGFTLFIYLWNIQGAIITKLFSGLLYMCILIYYYITIQRSSQF